MKQITLALSCMLFSFSFSYADGNKDSLELELEKQLLFIDSVENALHWDTSTVVIGNGIAKIKVPKGFKFLNATQSKFVLHDLWGNPERDDILGMIFPENGGPYADSSYVFVVSFEEDGYVKDGDADDIDYDDMFKDIKKAEPDLNVERSKEGYEPILMMGWAAKPYYDKNKKVLHWAKELKFGDAESNTLNYDVRVLGRKGILSLNAIAAIEDLPLVKANIDKVLMMPEFTEGNKYSDYNESTDKVAEYTIGALVAGSVLAKTGVLAMIGKFLIASWKFILIGLIAVGGSMRKIFKRKKPAEAEETDSIA
ncbi:MAG: DUF2167 domain-containing protein [Bacteroidota bacterium]